MYTSHFALQHKPFDFTPDPRFLWLNKAQRREMAFLRHALLEQNGFVLITGDVGTGKTILAKGLAKSVAKSASVITVPDPDMGKLDFFNYLADGFGLNHTFKSKADFLIGLKHLIRDVDSDSRKYVLIVDEAHRLSPEMMQEIRLLANIDLGDRMQLSTVLIGLPELRETLLAESNHNVMQRVAASVHLAPLNLDEMRVYILYRLRIAGSSRGIFTSAALKQIHTCTGGNQRLINLLCDHALVTAYAAGKNMVDSHLIQECVNELSITFFEKDTDSDPEESVAADSGAEQATAPIEIRPEDLSLSSNRLSRMKHCGIAIATVLLLCIGGYSFRGLLFGPQSPGTTNEQEVQNMVHVLESQPDENGSDLINERSFGHEMGDESDKLNLSGERPPQATEYDQLTMRKNIEVPATDKIDSPEGLSR